MLHCFQHGVLHVLHCWHGILQLMGSLYCCWLVQHPATLHVGWLCTVLPCDSFACAPSVVVAFTPSKQCSCAGGIANGLRQCHQHQSRWEVLGSEAGCYHLLHLVQMHCRSVACILACFVCLACQLCT